MDKLEQYEEMKQAYYKWADFYKNYYGKYPRTRIKMELYTSVNYGKATIQDVGGKLVRVEISELHHVITDEQLSDLYMAIRKYYGDV